MIKYSQDSSCIPPPPTPATPRPSNQWMGNLTIVHGIHPDHRHHLEEDFGLGFDELAAAAVPAGSFEVEAVHVNSLCRGLGDVILHPLCHLIEQNHAVQSPALVGPGDLLQVQGQIAVVTQAL